MPQALRKLAATEPGGATLKKLLVPRLRDQSPRTRELTLYYFTLIGAPATPEVEQSLTEIALHDDGEYARELAMVNLSSSFGAITEVAQTIRTVMQQDPSHAVQVRAASLFASMHARLPAKDNRRVQALAQAVEFFRQYGDGCERTDRAWGWRLLGNSLLQFGPDGEAALKALMADGEQSRVIRPRLADFVLEAGGPILSGHRGRGRRRAQAASVAKVDRVTVNPHFTTRHHLESRKGKGAYFEICACPFFQAPGLIGDSFCIDGHASNPLKTTIKDTGQRHLESIGRTLAAEELTESEQRHSHS